MDNSKIKAISDYQSRAVQYLRKEHQRLYSEKNMLTTKAATIFHSIEGLEMTETIKNELDAVFSEIQGLSYQEDCLKTIITATEDFNYNFQLKKEDLAAVISDYVKSLEEVNNAVDKKLFASTMLTLIQSPLTSRIFSGESLKSDDDFFQTLDELLDAVGISQLIEGALETKYVLIIYILIGCAQAQAALYST